MTQKFTKNIPHTRYTLSLYHVAMHSYNRTTNTRNSSGDEIANVNFLYDDIVHILQNTIDSCINSATDGRSYVF